MVGSGGGTRSGSRSGTRSRSGVESGLGVGLGGGFGSGSGVGRESGGGSGLGSNSNNRNSGAILSVSVSFELSSVGVSLIVEKPIRREFLSLTVSEVTGKFHATVLTRSIELVRAHCVCDCVWCAKVLTFKIATISCVL